MSPKIEFTLAMWEKTGSIFEGVQVIESKEMGKKRNGEGK